MNCYKAKQYLIATAKVCIVIAAFVFIGNRLFTVETGSWVQLRELFAETGFVFWFHVFMVFLLSVLNWGLEIFKWQYLAGAVKRISFLESSRQVLSAQTLALFTPFKIGEYGAKALFFPKNRLKKVVFLNFLGNMSQLTATLFFGFIGLGIYLSRTQPDIIIVYYLVLFTLIISGFLFYKSGLHTNLITKNISLSKAKKVIKEFSNQKKSIVLGLSFLRYVVFSFQFFYILNWLAPASFTIVIPLIFIMYLLSSAIPVLQLFDVVIKGSVAVLVISGFGDMVILTVTFTMWIFNVVLPAITGCYFVTLFNTKPLLKPEHI